MANKDMVVADKRAAMQSVQTGGLNVFSDAANFETALKMADVLSHSTVVPKDYQGNTGNCMIAIEMAARIKTSPMMVMQNLYVVNGRPAWSSQWIIAMINASRRYKSELQFEFGNDPKDGGLSCYAWAEDYSGHRVLGPKITMNMANSEGWTTKNNSKWKTMPEVMIQYRAASFFGRMNCPDMIMGIYTQDEVVDAVDLSDADIPMILDPETGEISDAPAPPELDVPITQEERQELFRAAKKQFGADCNKVLKQLVQEEGYDSTDGMLRSALKRIMEKIRKLGEESDAAQDASENPTE